MRRARQYVIAGLVLLLVAGLKAGPTYYKWSISGNTISGDFWIYNEDGSSANANIAPIGFEGGQGGVEAYMVQWGSCTIPEAGRQTCVYAAGRVPKAFVRMIDRESLEIDLDVSNMESVLYTGGWDCAGTECTYFEPVSVPLKGVLAPYRGDGSSRSEITGNQRSEYQWAGSQTTIRSGSWTNIRATFTGVCGELMLSGLPSSWSNAQITVMKGTTVNEWTITPP